MIVLQTKQGNNCNIIINSDFSQFDTLLSSFVAPGRRVIAIIDDNVERIYGSLFSFEKIIFHATEKDKSWESAGVIIQQLIEKQADKDTFLLGIGGGITTDITGFVAAIYKRGVDFAFVPTTLLAMVDASIGGKNGVNALSIKNMIGTIRQPKFVYTNLSFLKSFSNHDLYKAIPELLKVFLVDGKDYFAAADFFVEQYAKKLFEKDDDMQMWETFITKAIEIKCRIVEKDEFETGARRILNLGHTYAHAIEHCCPQYSHGEAVGIGLVLAAKEGNFPHIKHLIQTLQACELPHQLPIDISATEFHKAMLQDKKIDNQRLHLIVLEDVGKIAIREKEL